MHRVLLCLTSILALVAPPAAVALTARPSGTVSAPAPPPGPSRVSLRAALNPMAGVTEAARYVEGANVAALHAAAYLIDVRTVYATDIQNRAAVVRSGTSHSTGAVVSVTYTGDLSSVVNCIKSHESGNYSESSHPGSGSGAYQMIPDTFRAWFARWAATTGYSGPSYSYAYEAPPAVQDGILIYMLTHGGAGNYSMRFGNDPCTAGLPGGG